MNILLFQIMNTKSEEEKMGYESCQKLLQPYTSMLFGQFASQVQQCHTLNYIFSLFFVSTEPVLVLRLSFSANLDH